MNRRYTAESEGVLYEVSRWVAFQTEATLPIYARRIHYWIISGLLIRAGAVLAGFLVHPTQASALFVGILAPSIIARIRATYGERLTLGAKERGSLRSWLKG